ncbi:hypothetical protein [Demequina aurantiaca]|uniref:hypothetical protein n=1 Tax=Demequina aurantiaca TaxID=676200 RepID=UPI00078022C2|nr:hypothetical protein [Demequina aurantiaca]
MSEISIDGARIQSLAEDLQPSIDDVYESLGGTPGVDGGIAANMIALITSAAAEGAQTVPDSYLALMALVKEAVTDFTATEESAAQALRDYESQIEDS